VKRIAPLSFLILLFLLVTCYAGAQQRLNSLAVNGTLADAAGPYYFIDHGDSVTAYGRATHLASALGLTLTWQENTKTLVFRQGLKAMSLKTTTDIRTGLEKRTGVFTGDGLDIKSPHGIVVNGTSYVAIDPLALAFGLETAWHAGPRLLTVDTPAPAAVLEPAAAPAAVQSAAVPGTLPASSSPGPVRVGIHDDYARVAVDLGNISSYKVAVSGNVLTVTFPVSGAAQATLWPDNPFIENAFYTSVDGARTLVVTARHTLDPAGRGYRHAVTETGTLYFDFAPSLRGEPAGQLAGQQLQQVSVAPAMIDPVSPPSAVSTGDNRRVVILDPGHGGNDPGAQGYASEAELVLDVSLKVRSLLEAQGIEVLLTRDGNYHLDANKARDLAMRANMATPDRMMFVSIHANSIGGAKAAAAAGIETFVFGEPLDQHNLDRAREENGGGELGRALTEEAVKAANDPTTLILRETQLNYSSKLAHAVQSQLIRATGATDRGVKQNAFYVIKNSRTPSILVEIDFVSHPDEGRKLATAAYRDTVARAIAAGIMEFVNNGGTVARN
jgi:N-acetylmuramoyl-L-alanine amidase